jgi:1-phosphofructokinase family hexose kinase
MTLWCIAVNAAIDKTYVVPHFRAGAEYRLSRAIAVAGGKALNVAKTARILGVEHVVCTGFVGGRTGAWIARDLADRGIETDFIEVPGESRVNVLIADPTGAPETRLVEGGAPVDAAAGDKLLVHVRERVRPGDLVVVAGSLRPGLPGRLYAQLVAQGREAGARVYVDADADALRWAASERPDLVSPNEEEFRAWTGRRTEELPSLAAVAREAASGATVIITLGARGALRIGADDVWFAAAPAVTALSTVGSGDALLGGYVAATLRGAPPVEALVLGVAAGAANTLSPGPGVVEPEMVERLRLQVRLHTIDG